MNELWEDPLASAMVSTSFWGRNFTDRSRSLRKKAVMLKGSEDQYWETGLAMEGRLWERL